MRRPTKKQRALDEKIETIQRELHWAKIHVGRKDYGQAGASAKCAAALINQVDAAVHKTKNKTTTCA